MNYTENYHLPQWVKEDRIMMEDFNQMCRDLEQGITSTAHALEVQISDAKTTAKAAQAAAAKLPYVVGTYTGDGSASRNISLGFRPSFIIVSGQAETVVSTSGAELYFIATAGSTVGSMTAITNDGFWTKHINGGYPDLNTPDRIYDYIAFR